MTSCPRCSSPLLRNRHELVCPIHGLQDDQSADPRDNVEEIVPHSQRSVAANAGRAWSNEDRAFAINNKDVMAAKDIGAMLGRTERSVHHFLSKHSLPKVAVASVNHFTTVRKDVNEELEDRVRPGRLGQLAQELGLSHTAARLRLRRPRPTPRPSRRS